MYSKYYEDKYITFRFHVRQTKIDAKNMTTAGSRLLDWNSSIQTLSIVARNLSILPKKLFGG